MGNWKNHQGFIACSMFHGQITAACDLLQRNLDSCQSFFNNFPTFVFMFIPDSCHHNLVVIAPRQESRTRLRSSNYCPKEKPFKNKTKLWQKKTKLRLEKFAQVGIMQKHGMLVQVSLPLSCIPSLKLCRLTSVVIRTPFEGISLHYSAHFEINHVGMPINQRSRFYYGQAILEYCYKYTADEAPYDQDHDSSQREHDVGWIIHSLGQTQNSRSKRRSEENGYLCDTASNSEEP